MQKLAPGRVHSGENISGTDKVLPCSGPKENPIRIVPYFNHPCRIGSDEVISNRIRLINRSGRIIDIIAKSDAVIDSGDRIVPNMVKTGSHSDSTRTWMSCDIADVTSGRCL